jgi:hypothetical protein
VTEVVAGMSLPEVLLVLREDSRREAGRALVALQTQALAAFAVWDKGAGRRLEQFRRSLCGRLFPLNPSRSDEVATAFSAWGVSVESNP